MRNKREEIKPLKTDSPVSKLTKSKEGAEPLSILTMTDTYIIPGSFSQTNEVYSVGYNNTNK